MVGRLGEAAGTYGTDLFTGTPLVVLSGAVFVLLIGLFFPLYQMLYNSVTNLEEAEKHRQLEYANRFSLSAREQEIFNYIVLGMSNTEIADTLFITESTVKFHVGNIFKKTGFGGRLELIANYKLGNWL
ncbi:MAG: hypothetical protein GX973_01815 [Firmicutes bacterium]|nr:hypothetical protein [Bacillota bacterium]